MVAVIMGCFAYLQSSSVGELATYREATLHLDHVHMDVKAFKARFPEFTQVPEPLLQFNVDAAGLEFDPCVWGNLLDEGWMYLVAHKLTLTPFGQQARLATAERGTSTYWLEYARLRSIVAQGFRVA